MLNHGFTEIIKHFAGYMRIFDDAARARGEVDGEPDFLPLTEVPQEALDVAQVAPVTLPDYEMRGPFVRIPGADDGTGHPNPFNISYRQLESLPRPGQNFAPFEEADLEAAVAARFQLQVGNIIPEVHITYQQGGEQILALFQQINAVYDNDILHLGEWNGDLPARLVADLEALKAMAGEVTFEDAPQYAIPADLTPDGLREWFAQQIDDARADLEHDAPAHAHDDGADAPLLQNVVYVDGEADGETDMPDEDYLAQVTARLEAEPDEEFTPGVSTGGNTAFNSAQILDFHNTSFSVLVKGDSYVFDAIVQYNIAFDEAFAGTGGDWSHWFRWGSNEETPGQLLADNIASFTTSGQVVTAIGGFSQVANLNWTVDVFEGDFLDVCLIQQLNLIGDDDTLTGLYQSEGWNIDMGDNLALNITQFLSLDLQYDLVIIEGSYYEANIIFQQNVLLDADWLDDVEGQGDPSVMRNDAEIMHYGNTTYLFVPDGMDALYERIANGESDFTLDYELTTLLPNASTDLSVLYIKGDYYNVNIVEQTNIVSDSDILLAEEDTAANAGSNLLGNEAVIISGGALSTSQYLEGEQYEDSLLVQASLVGGEEDVFVAEADQLVPEVIAFLGNDTSWQRDDSGESGSAAQPVQQDDVMATVLV